MRAASPTVSVLMPVRNAVATVEQAVQSVLNQTHPDLELVLVDDGSRDGSTALLRAIARRDRRVQLIETVPRGIVSALCAAVERASAPCFARMDADDWCHPDRLRRQLAHLGRRPEVGAVGCLTHSCADGGWGRYQRWLNGCRTWRQIARDLLVESPLAHPSVLMRRRAYVQAGGYQELDGPEDYDLWLRMVRAGWRLGKVGSVLLDWRDSPRRLTRTDPRYRPEAFIRLKARHLALVQLAHDPRPIWIWGAGRHGRLLCRALEPLVPAARIQAFVDIDPNKIGRQRRSRPVLSPAALRTPTEDHESTPDVLVLVAVPVAGARALIRRRLTRLGYLEARDYWCCA